MKEKQRIFKTLELASEVYEKRNTRIPTSKLNDYLLPVIEKNPAPMASRGRYVKIKAPSLRGVVAIKESNIARAQYFSYGEFLTIRGNIDAAVLEWSS